MTTYRDLLFAFVATSVVFSHSSVAGASEAAKALAERFANEPAKTAPLVSKPQAASSPAKAKSAENTAQQRQSDERDMLERARAEADAVKPAAGSEAAGPTAIELERTAELKRLAEKLRQARLARDAKKLAEKRAEEKIAEAQVLVVEPKRDLPERAETRPMERKDFWKPEVAIVEPPRVEIESHSRSSLGMRSSEPLLRGNKVTVLLVMAPGSKGIRRFEKSADPIICSTLGCYVSSGSATPARLMPYSRATGFVNTWGERAGACRHSLSCVFRDIDLGDRSASLQPIDLKVVKHDRRQLQTVRADQTCRVTAGRLSCGQPVQAEDYVLWVVPEHVAELAGPDTLARAVQDGLPSLDQRASDTTRRTLQ